MAKLLPVLVFSTVSALALVPATTHAQAPAPAAAEEQGGGDIVVTALRRESTLQDTPVAISAFSGDDLARQGVTRLADIMRSSPGLNLTENESGRSRVSIRGIQASGEMTVGLFYDDIQVNGPAGTSADAGLMSPMLSLFDIERVEVLRGPQGTLYGGSSISGTLRVIFNKPDVNNYAGLVEGQVSGTQDANGVGYAVRGMVNAPIVEGKLAARATLYRERQPGWVDNITLGQKGINEATTEGGRLSLGWHPTDDLTITASAQFQNRQVDGSSLWSPSLNKYDSTASARIPWNEKLQLYGLTGTWDLGPVAITSATSYYRWKAQRVNDTSVGYRNNVLAGTHCRYYFGIDGSCTTEQQAEYRTAALATLPVMELTLMDLESFTQELRVSSTGKGPLQWTVGGFYEDRNDHTHAIAAQADQASGALIRPYVSFGDRFIDTYLTQKALFGELTYTLADRLTLTAGARHYDYSKDVGGSRTGVNYYIGQTPLAYTSVSADSKGWLTKFSASYKFSTDILGYVTASQGMRPGGANFIVGLPSDLVAYAPDKTWNYEAGVKSTLFDRKLTLNAAVYHIDWSNMQISTRTTDLLFSYISNASAADIDGFELEAVLRPVAGLTLGVSGNYLDARLSKDVSPTIAMAGDRIPYVSKYAGAAYADYGWALSDSVDAFVRLDYSYTGTAHNVLRPTNAYYAKQGDYSVFNLRASLSSGAWSGDVFVNNIFDKAGINLANSTPVDRANYVNTITPRTVGLIVRRSF